MEELAVECTMDVPYRELEASEIGPLLEEQECLIVDLRQPERFRIEHVKGAVNLPTRDLWQDGATELSQDRDLVLLCEDGTDSMLACEILMARGFAPERLINIVDGMAGWRKAGYQMRNLEAMRGGGESVQGDDHDHP